MPDEVLSANQLKALVRYVVAITARSTIRPDFDWGRHVNSGRIEAVLNHVGAKDGSVPFAHYTIPGTGPGPGGKVGYTSGAAYNVRNRDFGHSNFFKIPVR